MKIEELIQMHNRRLEQQAGSDPFLTQRLKARTDGRERTRLPFFWQLRKYALVYGLLFIVLTLINVFLIRSLEPKQIQPLSPELNREQAMFAFSPNLLEPDYPGSVSKAYAEVMK